MQNYRLTIKNQFCMASIGGEQHHLPASSSIHVFPLYLKGDHNG